MGKDSDAQAKVVALGEAMRPDRPCTDPSQDRFGYVPTARVIARTLRHAPAPTGLVLHIDGSWGSGKSSMLGLVEHALKSGTAQGQQVVQLLRFNPWWFSDHEHLAQQFLNTFAQALFDESTSLVAIGKLIAKYKESLSTLVASSATLLGVPVPREWVKWLAKTWFGRLVREQKDVSGLKNEITQRLRSAQQRFVVFIDDVDRLTPAEIDQVFRVVKAVADFPNVVYVLAFDREEVAKALSEELQVDGSAYLEKIVQVPFVLPTLRQDVLRDLLIDDVRRSAPEVRFEPGPDQYDANVLAAMGDLVRRPRDLVRFANAFAPTYAGLRGDVMAVDVAALELLRVVEPRVYKAIRENEQRFLEGRGEYQIQRSDLDPRDVDWNRDMTDARRTSIVRLLDRLFPRRARRSHSTHEMQRWAAQGRVCSERGYTTYFRQQRPDDELSPRELQDVLALADDRALAAVWSRFAAAVQSGSGSKATDLLAELRNIDSFQPDFAHALLATLMNDGDLVVGQARDGEPIEWLMWSAASKCVAALGLEPVDQLVDIVMSARALYSTITVVRYIVESSDRSSERYDPKLSNVGDQGIDRLRLAALARIRQAAEQQALLGVPKLPLVLESWKDWDTEAPMAANAWVGGFLGDDARLLELMRAFISWATSYQVNDAFATRVPRFEIQRFIAVLPSGVDLVQIESHLAKLESINSRMSDEQLQTIALFRSAVRSFEQGS